MCIIDNKIHVIACFRSLVYSEKGRISIAIETEVIWCSKCVFHFEKNSRKYNKTTGFCPVLCIYQFLFVRKSTKPRGKNDLL